jgi:hypothetical protein
MVEEIELDVGNGTLYLSPWLTVVGRDAWATLLRTAAQNGSDATLAAEIPRHVQKQGVFRLVCRRVRRLDRPQMGQGNQRQTS